MLRRFIHQDSSQPCFSGVGPGWLRNACRVWQWCSTCKDHNHYLGHGLTHSCSSPLRCWGIVVLVVNALELDMSPSVSTHVFAMLGLVGSMALWMCLKNGCHWGCIMFLIVISVFVLVSTCMVFVDIVWHSSMIITLVATKTPWWQGTLPRSSFKYSTIKHST